MPTRRIFCLVLGAALALSVAGCSPSIDLSQAKRVGDAPAAEPEPAQTLSAQEQKEADRAAAAESCFVGSWVADNASFGALFHSAGVAANDQITGVMRVTVDPGGTITTAYTDWTFDRQEFVPVRTIVPYIQNDIITQVYVLGDDGTFSSGADEAEAEESDTAYVCDGDKLTMQVLGSTATLTRSY